MNMKKGIMTAAMALLIGASTLSNVYASSNTNTTEPVKMMEGENGFETFSEGFKKNISKEDLKKAQELFNKANQLKEDGYAYWDQFYKLDLFDVVEHVEPMYKPVSFEEFSKDFHKDVKPEVKKQAKVLYEKILKLEDEEKFEEAMEEWDALYSLDLYGFGEMEFMSFEEYSKEFKKDIKASVLKNAEKIYNKAIALEKDGKIDEAMKEWDAFDKLQLFDDIVFIEDKQSYTFDVFSEGFKKDLKPEVIKEAEGLFNEAIKLEAEGKFDDANKIWDKLYDLKLYDEKLECEDGCDYDVIEYLAGEDYIGPKYEDFASTFKEGLKPEVIKQAKDLFEKAVTAEKDAAKVWNELDKMDIYDYTFMDMK